MRIVPLVLLAACAVPDSAERVVGAWTATLDADGALTLVGPGGQRVEGLRVELGRGTQAITTSAGAFLFDDVTTTWQAPDAAAWIASADTGASTLALTFGEDEVTVAVEADDGEGLAVRIVEGLRAVDGPGTSRARLSLGCDADEHVLGAGAHTFDVDHVGQAFPLWVSEQGIGKTDVETPPTDWFLTGTRHASYFPVPFFLRAQQPLGMLLDTTARVEVDLCAADSGRMALVAWDPSPTLRLFAADDALGVVEALTAHTGRPRRLPDWALAPWNDAVRGSARVREVAAKLRAAGAPTSVIWSEDWKGLQENLTGFRLSESWTVDRTMYPDVEDVDAELEAAGFKWFGYFAAFVGLDDPDGEAAVAADAVIRGPDGAPYDFPGVTFRSTSMPDVTGEAGRAWAAAKMQAAVDLGFDGWMTDFGEWLPTDAVLADGRDALAYHNAYPGDWQRVAESVLAPVDGVHFCRSGWSTSTGVCPVVWLGDQRTDFQRDDGYPSVLPLTLGLAASGVPVVTHDVAGYASFNNPTSTKELWFRWAWLGAFSPILRTHHGSSASENHQFDTDAETLALWVEASTEHMRLFPYRAALARDAAERGHPMVRPVAFHVDGEAWDRADAWLLGPSLLVAPVLEAGADGRDVALPPGRWYDWWTRAEAASGYVAAPPGTIPVYARAGTTVPLFDTVPDTLAPTTDPELVDLAEADGERVVLLFGGGGPFREADGTTYTPSGTPSGVAEVVETVQDGTIEAGGVTLAVSGPITRRYRVVVVP